MPVPAPLRVPVELRLAGSPSRWFRLAAEVSEQGLLLSRPLPGELDAQLVVTFHLPEDPAPLRLDARPIEVAAESGSRPERSAVRFLAPDEAARARIARYVEARLPPT